MAGECVWQGDVVTHIHLCHTPRPQYPGMQATREYGQCTGGTHPSGMHSCLVCLIFGGQKFFFCVATDTPVLASC